MQNYNYADEIIKDYDNLRAQKIDEQDILQNILNDHFGSQINAADAQDKIKGFMEGLKTDNIIANIEADKLK